MSQKKNKYEEIQRILVEVQEKFPGMVIMTAQQPSRKSNEGPIRMHPEIPNVIIVDYIDLIQIEQLIKSCIQHEYERYPEKDFDGVKVYKVESDGGTLAYWNSSNSLSINHDHVLGKIAVELLDEEYGGTVMDDFSWAEIMFEVE